MIESVPKATRDSIRNLRRMLSGTHSCGSVEEFDAEVSRRKEEISDVVITILMREDAEKQERFLSEK